VVPILVSWVGLEKNVNKLKLGGEKYFCKVIFFARSHSEHHRWICPYKEAPKIVALLHVAGAPHFSLLSPPPPLSLSLSLYVSHERGVLTERQTANIAIATHQHMCNACGFCLFWPIQNLLPFWRPAGWLTYLLFVVVVVVVEVFETFTNFIKIALSTCT
jgi:hypothetical protein